MAFRLHVSLSLPRFRSRTEGRFDGRAVTPLVAIVLLVALTVTMAAIAVPFVFASTDQVEEQTPRAQFAFAYAEDVDTGVEDSLGNDTDDLNLDVEAGEGGLITVVLETGESIPANQLDLVGTTSSGTLADGDEYDGNERVLPGEEIRIWAERGDTLQIIWRSEGGGEGAILDEFTVHPTE